MTVGGDGGWKAQGSGGDSEGFTGKGEYEVNNEPTPSPPLIELPGVAEGSPYFISLF